jgi:Sulfotransferase family
VTRLPDFFIVGHPKCGTTAMYEMLSGHPQVFLPERKEPRWFSTDLRSPFREGADGLARDSYEDYLALFAPARSDQLIGEASTNYIWSHTAAAEIAAVRPDARVIVIFREPASFVRSLHEHHLQHKAEEEPSLRRALELEADRREGRHLTKVTQRWPQQLFYAERVRYVDQLRRYDAVFPAGQLLVLIYDDFRADNDGTLRQIQRFLGIEETGAAKVLEANESVHRRADVDSRLHDAFFGGGPMLRAARRGARILMPEQARQRAFGALRERLVFTKPPPPDEQLMSELRARFAPEVQGLSEYLDRDLASLWGYP